MSNVYLKSSYVKSTPVFFYWIFRNPLRVKPTKWPNTLKQFVGHFPTNCLSVFDHFVGLAVKGLSSFIKYMNV